MLMRWILRAVPVLALSAGCCFSAPLTITFASSLLNATQGQTVTFTATVANTTTSTVFLNGDALNVAAPLIGNDTKFLLNFPLSLAGNQMFTAPAFDITVPANAPAGLYPGNFDILGGSSSTAQTNVGSAVFAVNVPVPEPGTLGALLVGLSGLALLLTHKRRAGQL